MPIRFVRSRPFLLILLVLSLLYAIFKRKDYLVLDYILWVLTFLTMVATKYDLDNFSNEFGPSSSLTLEILGVLLSLAGRLVSFFYSMYKKGFYSPLLGHGIADVTAFKMSSLVVAGSVLVALSLLIHVLYKRPFVFAVTVSYKEVFESIKLKTRPLTRFLSRTYLSIAFLIAFLARLVPEIKYWPLPIGWDTVLYIAYLKDYAVKLNPFTSYIWGGGLRDIPPLMAMLYTPLRPLVDPLYFMKLWQPFMLGLVATVSAYIVRKRFGADPLLACFIGVASAMNPLTVGSTQNWGRHMLGLVTLMIYLAFVDKPKVRPLALVAMALAYEPTAALAVILSVYELFRSRNNLERIVYVVVFIVSLKLALWYSTPIRRWYPSPVLGGVRVPGVVRSRFDYYIVRFMKLFLVFLVPYLPVLELRKQMPTSYKLAFGIIFLAFASPIISDKLSVVADYRWGFMLISALTPLALFSWSKASMRAFIGLAMVFMILGGLYVDTSNGYKYLVPVLKDAAPSGFPWRFVPAFSPWEMDNFKNISEYIVSHGLKHVLVGGNIYPALHLFIRSPFEELVPVTHSDLSLKTIIPYMKKTKTSKAYVVTLIDLSKELSILKNEGKIKENVTVKVLLSGFRSLYLVEIEHTS